MASSDITCIKYVVELSRVLVVAVDEFEAVWCQQLPWLDAYCQPRSVRIGRN